jgi:Na+/H+ antiporter NhaD/arsenite permease-like protein
MKKRTESVIDFIVTLFMVTVVFAVIGIICMTLYYMIRTKIDKIKAKRAKKREKKKVLAESGRCMIYKGKFVYR